LFLPEHIAKCIQFFSFAPFENACGIVIEVFFEKTLDKKSLADTSSSIYGD
jgi:hypothetical protein